MMGLYITVHTPQWKGSNHGARDLLGATPPSWMQTHLLWKEGQSVLDTHLFLLGGGGGRAH
jgi:hypothetical protein